VEFLLNLRMSNPPEQT